MVRPSRRHAGFFMQKPTRGWQTVLCHRLVGRQLWRVVQGQATRRANAVGCVANSTVFVW